MAVVAWLVCLLTHPASVGATTPDSVVADEQVLREAHVRTDGPALLDYFRRRIATDATRTASAALVTDLGNANYRVRTKSAAELLRFGSTALPALRAAMSNPDPEVAHRAEECRRQIEDAQQPGVDVAAARLLAERPPPDTVAVLLAYLPEADEPLADEIRATLAAVARRAADPILIAALADPHPVRRAAAADALAHSGSGAAVRNLLHDPEPMVRFRVALALAAARDREAVPVLIDCLADLPAIRAWPAEDVLLRLAGDDAPQVTLSADPTGARKCRDAWRAWWERRGAAVDLSRLEGETLSAGVTVFAQTQPGGTGSIVEVGPDHKPRRELDGLQYPVAISPVSHDRVLIVEFAGGRVSERDFSGKVYWETAVVQPVGCQRLPGGRTFIAARGRVLEVDRTGHELWSVPAANVATAAKRSDGKVVVLSYTGRISILDAAGQEVRGFAVGRCQGVAGFDLTAGGRVLVPEYYNNRVAEYDTEGRTVWSAEVLLPSSVVRLSNGNNLVASQGTRKIVELDRLGRTVWEHLLPENARLWQARRR